MHIYIVGTALLVFGLVGLVLFASSHKNKIDLDHGALSYVKFIWASFLKPHDKSVEGQQGALESFYKAQVGRTRAIHAEVHQLKRKAAH